MEKKQIINMIRRIAEADSGKAPGSQRLESETGVKRLTGIPSTGFVGAMPSARLDVSRICSALRMTLRS
jgi:hypothetical protein